MPSTAKTELTEVQQHIAAMLNDMHDQGVWSFAVTVAGKAQIAKPGWEVTREWEDMFQAIAISSRYRFAGQGKTPSEALADAYKQMREFSKELKRHMEAT